MKFGKQNVDINVFAQSEREIAIYNIAPIVPGHILVLPKKQIGSLDDLTEDELWSFFSFARTVTKFITQEFKAEGYDWTIQDGKYAGQTVPHLHLHVIPRVKGDFPDIGDWYPALKQSLERTIDSKNRATLNEADLIQIVEHLRSEWEKVE